MERFLNQSLGDTKHYNIPQPLPGRNKTWKGSPNLPVRNQRKKENLNLKRFLKPCLGETNMYTFLYSDLEKSNPEYPPQILPWTNKIWKGSTTFASEKRTWKKFFNLPGEIKHEKVLKSSLGETKDKNFSQPLPGRNKTWKSSSTFASKTKI